MAEGNRIEPRSRRPPPPESLLHSRARKRPWERANVSRKDRGADRFPPSLSPRCGPSNSGATPRSGAENLPSWSRSSRRADSATVSQQAGWPRGRLFFHKCDAASFYAQPFSEFPWGEPCFLSEQPNGFSKCQKMTRRRIMRIGRHVALMKLFEIVVHRYPGR